MVLQDSRLLTVTFQLAAGANIDDLDASDPTAIGLFADTLISVNQTPLITLIPSSISNHPSPFLLSYQFGVEIYRFLSPCELTHLFIIRHWAISLVLSLRVCVGTG